MLVATCVIVRNDSITLFSRLLSVSESQSAAQSKQILREAFQDTTCEATQDQNKQGRRVIGHFYRPHIHLPGSSCTTSCTSALKRFNFLADMARSKASPTPSSPAHNRCKTHFLHDVTLCALIKHDGRRVHISSAIQASLQVQTACETQYCLCENSAID